MFKNLKLEEMAGTRKPSTPSHWRIEFQKRMRHARQRSGLRPVEIASFLRVPVDTYNRWETRALMPHHLIIPFCELTGADPMELFTGRPFDLGKLLSRSAR